MFQEKHVERHGCFKEKINLNILINDIPHLYNFLIINLLQLIHLLKLRNCMPYYSFVLNTKN